MSSDQRWQSVKADNYWFALLGAGQSNPGDAIHQDLQKKLILGDQRNSLNLFYTKTAPEIGINRSIGVLFDGELYNKNEIVSYYQLATDQNCAQLIAQLYSIIGSQVIEKIKGIYSLIIWDQASRHFLCVRDRLGIYPLFYSIKDDDLYVSTSIESLTKYAAIDRQIDRLQLAEHLLNRWIEPERTYYQNIKRLLPGNVLQIKGNSIDRYRYWQRLDQPLEWATAGELANFDDLLKQAVTRIIDNKRVGIFLSSGIDSVTVAVIAAQLTAQAKTPTRSLSLHFPNPDKDESIIQNQVAERLGFSHSLISLAETLGTKDPLGSFLTMSMNWPSPPIVFWSPSFYYLALKAVEQGCQVILTGEGGDEWLGVGPYLAADLVTGIKLRGLYDFWHYLNRTHTLTKFDAMKLVLWKFSLRPVLGNALRNTLFKLSPELFEQRTRRLIIKSLPNWLAIDADLKAELIEKIYQFTERQAQILTHSESLYTYNGQIYFEHPVTSMAHEQTFEMGRRTGVKILAPFLDSDLIDLLIKAPPDFLIRNGYGKAPTRKILVNKFPDLNFDKQKKYFLDPSLDKLLMERFSQIYKTDQLPARLIELGIIDKQRFNEYKDRNIDNHNSLFYFREILNLETWLSGR